MADQPDNENVYGNLTLHHVVSHDGLTGFIIRGLACPKDGRMPICMKCGEAIPDPMVVMSVRKAYDLAKQIEANAAIAEEQLKSYK